MLATDKDLRFNFEKQLAKANQGQPYSAAYVADCYLHGWGVEADGTQYIKALAYAANSGDARSCIQMFFIALANNDTDNAIMYLNNCKNKEKDKHSIPSMYVEKLLEKINANRSLTPTEIFNSLNENDDEYLIALCYLFGYGCQKDIPKASSILIDFVRRQINNQTEFGVLAAFYPPQILLLLCLFEKGNDEGVNNTIAELVGRVAFSGDYSVAEDDDIINNPNMRAGFYELTLINFSNVTKLKKDLCIRYALDISDNGKEYPTYNDLLEEAVGLSQKDEDVKDLLILIGTNADNNVRYKAGEQLINSGYAAAGYSILAVVYENSGNYAEAFKFLNNWANANSSDEECLSSTAQYWIGNYYYEGKGVEKDIDKSFEWWSLAAQNGSDEAAEMLQIAYDAGDGNINAGIAAIKEAEYWTDSVTPSNSSANTQSSGGCYVATCVYGSYECPEVWTLRRYRDYDLSQTWHGRLFIKFYYAISPTIVRIFGKNETIKKIWKMPIDRLVKALQERGYESTEYNDRDWS